MKERLRQAAVVFIITSCIGMVIKAVVYFSTPKCYEVTITAERSGEQLHLRYQVQFKKEVDVALRRAQSLVPKDFDITSVDTSGEGRGWFCQQP